MHRLTRVTTRLAFTHALAAPLARVELALLDPAAVSDAPRALRTVSAATLLALDDRGDLVTRDAHYLLAPGFLPPFAERLAPRIGWFERVTWSRSRHEGRFTVRADVPAAIAARTRCEGTYRLLGSPSGATRRVIDGAIDIRIPLAGPIVEERLAAMLAAHFADEAAYLASRARRAASAIEASP